MSDDNHSNHKLYQHKDHTEMQGCSVNRKIKRDGTCKTRICAQGFSQIWGTHYDRTHSPCIGHSSMRYLH